jgi:hypothetical protein
LQQRLAALSCDSIADDTDRQVLGEWIVDFLKRLKFWNAKAVIENTVEAVLNDYSYYKRQDPDRDRHFWLAAVFMNRPGYGDGKGGTIIPFAETALFSVLNEEHAALALAYFFLSQEMPFAIMKIGKQWEAIMRPANELIAQGSFLKKWVEINPWTARNISGIRESVRAIQDKNK